MTYNSCEFIVKIYYGRDENRRSGPRFSVIWFGVMIHN